MSTCILTGDSPSFLKDETLHEAYELSIESKNGAHVRFGELVAGKGDSVTTIVIFVRHFFCLYDQGYVKTLSRQLTQTLLDTIPASAKPAQVIIIGCGDHSLIVPYMEETSDAFPIYTDPTGKIYETLHMKRTMEGITSPPPYTPDSFPSALGKCLKQIWKRGWAGLKGGKWNQQGGEWIFQRGRLRYAHLMEGVNDHLTADQLFQVLKTGQRQDSLSVTGSSGEMSEAKGASSMIS
ncbi:Thioredoxin-like protein AAED1 [Penicillium subrubescens]|uniref:Thioredoxin-like protein AAED1 n=1 Tax=Penicillium subrubescens TaxID=1316194 RepID=A0A1Q5TFC2_9EURO|nr:Thioredoxin-like protein AAED1 [Penicillium subrubescens]